MTDFDALNRTILLCRDYLVDELSDEEIVIAFQSLRVLCVADALSLSCHSGQTALMTLVSLLSRMGMQVGLAIPDVAVLKPQVPFHGRGIRTALLSSSEQLMPGATVRSADTRFSPDIIFVFGAADIEGGHVPCWRVAGTDWSGSICCAASGPTQPWNAEWPIGGMVSALLAANEAFKCAMRSLKLRNQADEIFFAKSQACDWDFGAIPLPEGAIDLGRVDVISAGAISQAALYALTRLPRVQMRGRIFDDDVSATSNLNRNMLTLVEDVGISKVEVITARCGSVFQLEPVPKRFTTDDGHVQLASRVLVGVDDIPSRWVVQRQASEWVGVGGTSHFSISSSSHITGQPCSGCLHPVDDPDGANPIPTVSFVSLWAGLAMAVRLVRECLGRPYATNRQHLWLTPLRMDQRRAGNWLPVAPLRDCPVHCLASQLLP